MSTNVLFFSPTGHIGGAETHLVNMCKYLPRQGIVPTVVLPNEGALPGHLNKLGVRTIFLSPYFLQSGQIFNVLLGCVMVWWKTRKLKIDIVHANSIFCLYVPVYFGRFTGRKVFVHWADFDVQKGDRQLVNFFAKNTTIIAVSQCIHRTLIANGINPKIIRLLNYGIEAP